MRIALTETGFEKWSVFDQKTGRRLFERTRRGPAEVSFLAVKDLCYQGSNSISLALPKNVFLILDILSFRIAALTLKKIRGFQQNKPSSALLNLSLIKMPGRQNSRTADPTRGDSAGAVFLGGKLFTLRSTVVNRCPLNLCLAQTHHGIVK